MSPWKIAPVLFALGLSASCARWEDRGPLLVSDAQTPGGNFVWSADGTEIVYVGPPRERAGRAGHLFGRKPGPLLGPRAVIHVARVRGAARSPWADVEADRGLWLRLVRLFSDSGRCALRRSEHGRPSRGGAELHPDRRRHFGDRPEPSDIGDSPGPALGLECAAGRGTLARRCRRIGPERPLRRHHAHRLSSPAAVIIGDPHRGLSQQVEPDPSHLLGGWPTARVLAGRVRRQERLRATILRERARGGRRPRSHDGSTARSRES